MQSFPFIKKSLKEIETYSVSGKPLQPDLIKLNQNENPFDVPLDLKRELLDELLRQPWHRYPDTFPVDLLKALAGYTGHPVEGIIAGNGSNELMYTIFMATVGAGTKVLIPTPTFFLYEKAVRVFDGTVIPVPMHDDLSYAPEKILEAIEREHPSVIVLVSPNSPTARSLTLEDIESIVNAADGLVIVDEAYIEFSDHGSVQQLLQGHENLVILRTFSKAFSMAGLRVGYLLAEPRLAAELLKPKIPFAVHAFSALTAIRMMEHRPLLNERIAYLKEGRRWLEAQMRTIPEVEIFPSDTNFLIFSTPQAAGMLFQRLLENNVLIRDVSSYPMMERMLRVNTGLKEENERFISVLNNNLQVAR
ncbi:MAG: histidinol-phosphate transaminase [Ignavibacteriales bacterium]|nr:histidinol-phosphate transaminase [Ignavibacteriales bacterium]